MTPETLHSMLGHQAVLDDLDVKTLILDLIREKLSTEEMMALFWQHLPDLDEPFVRGYLYHKRSS